MGSVLGLSETLLCAGEQPVCGGRIDLPHIYRCQPHDHSRGHVLHGRPGPGRALQGEQLSPCIGRDLMAVILDSTAPAQSQSIQAGISKGLRYPQKHFNLHPAIQARSTRNSCDSQARWLQAQQCAEQTHARSLQGECTKERESGIDRAFTKRLSPPALQKGCHLAEEAILPRGREVQRPSYLVSYPGSPDQQGCDKEDSLQRSCLPGRAAALCQASHLTSGSRTI